MRFLSALPLLLALLPLMASAQTRPAAAVAKDADHYISAYVQRGDFAGCALIAAAGEVLFEGCYGMAERQHQVPHRPDTRFRIGSLSKQFTAAGIMLLQQQGKLRVTDPLTDFLPAFPHGERITLHHLLTHTSGVRNSFGLADYETLYRADTPPAGWVRSLAAQPLDFEPGTGFSYSNSGYILLARVIEIASGQPYGRFLQEQLFDPLGMADSGHDDAARVMPNRAAGYDPLGYDGVQHAPPAHPAADAGPGSIYSTLRDLYRWDRALYEDTLLTAASKLAMFTAHAGGHYGYGFAAYQSDGRRVLGHDGRVPGFSADMARYPDDGLVTIVLSNVQTGIGDAFRRDLSAIAFGKAWEMPPKRPAAAPAPDAKQRVYCTGTYAFGPTLKVHVKAEDGRLWAAAGNSQFTELTPLADGSYLNRVTYAGARFEGDADGHAARMLWLQDGNTFTGQRQTADRTPNKANLGRP